jgi:hypothetical protein
MLGTVANLVGTGVTAAMGVKGGVRPSRGFLQY